MKITFMGAGSTIFAKNVLGDCMVSDTLHDIEIALYDIDETRLNESFELISAINKNCNDHHDPHIIFFLIAAHHKPQKSSQKDHCRDDPEPVKQSDPPHIKKIIIFRP